MNKKLKNILIAIICVLIFVLLIVFYFLDKRITKIPEGTIGNTAGNSYNNGLFCEYGGTVYFSNPYDSNALYSMRSDGTHIKKLIDADVSHINAGGDYLFYFQGVSSGTSGLGYLRASHAICRAKLDGSKITNLSKDVVFNMQLINNHLYYQTSTKNGPEFYKLKIDKSEKELLGKNSYNFSCAQANGEVYYSGTETNHYLYKYDVHTGGHSVFWEGNLWYPIMYGEYIYYLDVPNDYRLCRYNPSADQVEILTHDRVDCYNIAGNYIYYQKNSADAPALKRMHLDGSNAETIQDGNYTHISVTSQYVYFQNFETPIPLYRIPVDGAPVASTFDAALEAAIKAGKK